MFKKVFTLQFDEEPPYEYIINSIKGEMKNEVKIGPDLKPIAHKFEWTLNIASRLKDKILQENNQFKNSESQQSLNQ